MQPRGKIPPMTAAERQRQCRARKRGKMLCLTSTPCPPPPGLPAPNEIETLTLPAPMREKVALPAPAVTAIEKTRSRSSHALAKSQRLLGRDALQLNLPAAVAARLESLLKRHESGQTLTDAEREEADGLLDIAEYFAVVRMRKRLAA